MRRRARLALVAGLAATMLAGPVTSAAADALSELADDPAPILLLAVEATPTGDAPPAGPEPGSPDSTANPAAPETYTPSFIWAASVGLLGLTVALTVVVGGLYYLMVYRPAHRPRVESD